MTTPARTIFFGTGDFAFEIIESLAHDHPGLDLIAVVTAPPRVDSRGRPLESPVSRWVEVHDVPMLRPERLRAPESIAQIAELRPDLIVLADYGQIVPQAILDMPRHGALNVHPSLLPRHRGATPIPTAILTGDDQTGVTIMLMDAGLDSGPIIGQSTTALDGTETTPALGSDLAGEAVHLLEDLLPAWLAGEIEPRPQPTEGVTYTRPLRREDGRLDPSLPAAVIDRHVRAYQPWPGTFFETRTGRIKIWRSYPAPGDGQVGTLLAVRDRVPAIATADGLLELVEVQPAGGRRMSGAEFLRGRPDLVGTVVAAPPPKARPGPSK